VYSSDGFGLADAFAFPFFLEFIKLVENGLTLLQKPPELIMDCL